MEQIDHQVKKKSFLPTKKKHEEPVYFACPGKVLAVKNVVTYKATHIQNFGKSYYWCRRKAIKPVGVPKESLSEKDRKVYDSACKFYQLALSNIFQE